MKEIPKCSPRRFKAAERAIVEESEYRTWASAMMEGGPPLDLLGEPRPRYRFLKRTDSLALLGLEAWTALWN